MPEIKEITPWFCAILVLTSAFTCIISSGLDKSPINELASYHDRFTMNTVRLIFWVS